MTTTLSDKLVDLECICNEVMEYLEDRYDVVDGDYGQPHANREMQMGMQLEAAMKRVWG